MASFVIHYIAGEQFINSINNKISDDDKNNFRLGNLVVDAVGRDSYSRDYKLSKKMITHFRDEIDFDKNMQLPNVEEFRNKYRNLVSSDYSAMGYLFHLYTDKLFFKYLYDSVIECYDKNMNKTDKISNNYYVKVLKNNKIYKTIDFYSGNSIGGLYKDYSKMNKYLINKYNIRFDYEVLKNFSLVSFNNPGIEEIDYNNILEVIDKMNNIISNCDKYSDNRLDIFDIKDIEKFIFRVVDEFNYNFSGDIKSLARKR